MTPRGRFITITLMAVLMPFAGPGTSVWAQSYTAPAGIPPETAPGGLTGVHGSQEMREGAASFGSRMTTLRPGKAPSHGRVHRRAKLVRD